MVHYVPVFYYAADCSGSLRAAGSMFNFLLARRTILLRLPFPLGSHTPSLLVRRKRLTMENLCITLG